MAESAVAALDSLIESISDTIVKKSRKIALMKDMLAQQNYMISLISTEERLRNYHTNQEILKNEQKELNSLRHTKDIYLKQKRELTSISDEKKEKEATEKETEKDEDSDEDKEYEAATKLYDPTKDENIPPTKYLTTKEIEELEVSQFVGLIDQATMEEECHQKAAKEFVFLSHVINKGNLDSLIASGLNVNKKFSRKNEEDVTPLGFACETQNPALIELLLKTSADPNLKATENLTPLELCLINSFETDVTIECVRVLAEHGVEFEIDPAIQDCCSELFRIIVAKLSK